MLTIFKYLCWKSPETLWRLLTEYRLNFFDYVFDEEPRITELMHHDHYRRVRGALRQMGSGVVVR